MHFACIFHGAPIISLIIIQAVKVSNSATPTPPTLNQGSVKFAMDLYKVLKEKEGNVFASPFSMRSLLAMMYAGAKGSTADELATALKLPNDKMKVLEQFTLLYGALAQSNNEYILQVANRIYMESSLTVTDVFKEAAVTYFQSGIEEADFSDNEGTRKAINNYVQEKTHDKIKDLFPAGSLDKDSQCVLVNAVYFAGTWQTKFNEKQTRPDAFYLDERTNVTVQMMKVQGVFPYGSFKELEAEVLELPYVGGHLSMYVVLPFEKEAIHDVEKNLEEAQLDQILAKLKSNQVSVKLPRFRLEETMDFNDVLPPLGLLQIFTTKADFSDIVKGQKFHVSDGLQKAFIEVNEQGSEAAAASRGTKKARTLAHMALQFTATHPFLFFILEKRTGTMLFMGSLRNPSKQPTLRKW